MGQPMASESRMRRRGSSQACRCDQGPLRNRRSAPANAAMSRRRALTEAQLHAAVRIIGADPAMELRGPVGVNRSGGAVSPQQDERATPRRRADRATTRAGA